MQTHLRTAALVLAGLALGCGGGGGGGGGASPASSALAYSNPASGDYRLVANPASAGNRLLLDLVGPGTTSPYGVGFYLMLDGTKATWSPINGRWAASTAFVTPLIRGKVQNGVLQLGIYQLGSAYPPSSSRTLATLALELIASGLPTGTTVSLQAGSALLLVTPGGSPTTQPITISVGTLRVQ